MDYVKLAEYEKKCLTNYRQSTNQLEQEIKLS